MRSVIRHRARFTHAALVFAVVAVNVVGASAQSPWEASANRLMATFVNLARPLAVVAVIIAGLLWMAGEGSMRSVANIVFGGAMALFAVQFIAWLF